MFPVFLDVPELGLSCFYNCPVAGKPAAKRGQDSYAARYKIKKAAIKSLPLVQNKTMKKTV